MDTTVSIANPIRCIMALRNEYERQTGEKLGLKLTKDMFYAMRDEMEVRVFIHPRR
jgi:hypothetical protein